MGRRAQRMRAFTLLAGFGLVMLVYGCGRLSNDEPGRVIVLDEHFEAASFVPRGQHGPADRYVPGRAAWEPGAPEGVFSVADSGRLVIPIRPASLESMLIADIRVLGSVAPNSPHVRASLVDPEGRQRELGFIGELARSWTSTEWQLGAEPGGYRYLLLDIQLGEAAGSLQIRRPRLILAEVGPVPATRQQSRPGPTKGGRPDVIVVILDAARASHFSAYGYERDTTSHIDRLAAEGMVFRNAFSECPSTVCSIPNLISGIPFLDLGADERGRLNGAIVTLAEYLAARGYRTIGVSANMHNSRSRNSDQGFDQFIEMWEREGGEFDPHLLSERAIEALRAVELEEPVFLQLHYLPPHEPYAPGPEFDVFGDSDYRGFVRPGMALEIRSAYGPTGDPAEAGSVRAVRDGQRTLPPADLQEMLALYDGNLRKADDAVGRLFDALRDQGRWENSIILVTSDHGEAFFEHGYQGHNTTLYREMLHVPFILRVPNRDAANRADTDRLVVLSDVVPTILGRLGIKPAPEVGGMDLLATRDDRPRAIFHRMGQRLLSTRTRRWNAIFTRVWDEPMLFDLVADPGELENVAERYPLVHHGLAALLNQHLSEVESRGGLASQEAEIPEEELEALRALGYVQ